jgi:hypothetical protein
MVCPGPSLRPDYPACLRRYVLGIRKGWHFGSWVPCFSVVRCAEPLVRKQVPRRCSVTCSLGYAAGCDVHVPVTMLSVCPAVGYVGANGGSGSGWRNGGTGIREEVEERKLLTLASRMVRQSCTPCTAGHWQECWS